MRGVLLVLAALMLGMVLAQPAQAQCYPVYPVYPAPVYVAPAPVYVAPAPVYVPPPVVVQPAPVYAAPAPVIIRPRVRVYGHFHGCRPAPRHGFSFGFSYYKH